MTALVAVLVVAAPLAAGAQKGATTAGSTLAPAFVAPSLLEKAASAPNSMVDVIITSSDAKGARHAVTAFRQVDGLDVSSDAERLKDKYDFVASVSATIKAKKVKQLGRIAGLTVTPDSTVRPTSLPTSKHLWPTASNIRPFYGSTGTVKTPTIAIVDSGIDKNRLDFSLGARVVADVKITKLEPNSPGDGRGHGTFVAGIAAGSAPDQAGAAPGSNIVSLDVMDDFGMARTSDVIAAAEWIYENRATYNIRVANFSLHSTTPSNFTRDPLDKAVEKLWFSGVVVVVAAGNYGIPGGPSGVKFAPGNDPFVITVGAVDLANTVAAPKHDVPNWSAYGYTYDGFRKPELAAPGRYMIGPVPATSTLARDKAENLVGPGYIRLSGTSFAAPIVAGAAAQILGVRPNWTPDQVKGALMQRARYVREAPAGSAGVGEINARRSADLTNPPNPNAALRRFLMPDPAGGSTPVFDAVSWSDAAKSSASWDSVSWSDASWSDVSWTDASWADVSWTDVSWTDVSWSDVLAAEDVSWEDNAGSETASPAGEYILTPEEAAAAAADPELAPLDTASTTTTTTTTVTTPSLTP